MVNFEGLTSDPGSPCLSGMKVAVFLIATDDLGDNIPDGRVHGFTTTVDGEPFFATETVRSPLTADRWPTFGQETALNSGQYTLMVWFVARFSPFGTWLPAEGAGVIDACATLVTVTDGEQTSIHITATHSHPPSAERVVIAAPDISEVPCVTG